MKRLLEFLYSDSTYPYLSISMYEPSFLYVISPQKTRDLFSAMAVSIYFDLFSVYVLEKCVGEGVTYPKMFHLLNRNNVQK